MTHRFSLCAMYSPYLNHGRLYPPNFFACSGLKFIEKGRNAKKDPKMQKRQKCKKAEMQEKVKCKKRQKECMFNLKNHAKKHRLPLKISKLGQKSG